MPDKKNNLIKPRILRGFLVLLVFILFSGCEGFRTASGTVVDDQTGQALDNVSCNVVSGRMVQITDATGKFNLQNQKGYCSSRGCKDITIEFSKNGYQTKRLTNPQASVIVRLTK